MTATRLALLVLAIRSLPAYADDPIATATTSEPQPEPEQPVPVERPRVPAGHTAGEVAGAPLPGDESGRTDRVDTGDSSFRILARGALFVPKIATEVVLSPIRATVWADDRYQLTDLYYRVFWNDARTIGLYPTVGYETGLGVVGGARFDDKDLFGEQEQLSLQTTYGMSYRMSQAVRFRTGNRLGNHVQIGIDGDFDRYPRLPFYGIGNSEDEVPPPPTAIDPLVDPTAVETFYRYQEARGAAVVDWRVISDAHVIARGALSSIQVARSTHGLMIDGVYDPAGLIGFTDDTTHGYGELDLSWDSRRRVSIWEPRDVHGEGSLALGYIGGVGKINGQGGSFWHYGTELQHYFHLAPGPRVLSFRFHGEGVTGSLDEVPFYELPYLGGDAFLRGYVYQRFRDRVAAVASAQYEWDVGHNVDVYLFVDAGRVYSSLDELTLSDLRMGYGVGLEIHDDPGTFLMEGSLASSIDGGIVLSLSFNPVLDARTRWR